MKYLDKHTITFPMLAYHRATGDTLWNVMGFRGIRNITSDSVTIVCMKDNPKESYIAGTKTWCDVNNLYAAPDQLISNKAAKYLLEEDF